MSSNMTKESLDYFQQYRKMIQEQQSIQEQIKDMQESISRLSKQSNHISSEIIAMKRIMTYMIDNGVDPVEAKLKIDENNKDTHWRDEELEREKDYLKKVLMQQQMHTTMGTLGAVGATGAIGTYNTIAPIKTHY